MDQVYDGDTLRLTDGRKVRLAGIDAPELGHDRQPEEPFGSAARLQLQRILDQSDHQVRLLPAIDTHDRYGRLLAHLYTRDRVSIQARLLEAGLALVNIHPPNLTNLDCYLGAEKVARRRGLALWRQLPTPAAELTREQRGLALVQGLVRSTHSTRRSLWINLEGGTALRIARDDLALFSALYPAFLPGIHVEARGWLAFHQDRPTLRIRHPAALVRSETSAP